MATVEVKFTKSDGIGPFLVTIDDKKLNFQNGKASRSVSTGDHALTWFVRGEPFSKYTIEITAPPSAVFKHSGIIDDSNTDAGIQWFRVGEVA
jgi:hypothetical protein